MWYYERESLVEYGIARFIGGTAMTNQSMPTKVEEPMPVKVEEPMPVKVEEPLALVSIMRYFESRHLTLDGNIRARLQDNQGTAFEEAALLAITKLLRDGEELRNIFQFHERTPSWARCAGQIVTRTSSGDYKPFDIIDDKPVLPSTGVAFYAEYPEDVKWWLESGETGWCVPGNRMGPDLMTWLRLSNGRLLLLVIQAKCHLAGNIDTLRASATAQAIRSLIPSGFFASLVCKPFLFSELALILFARRKRAR
jgi:hypothetical protein